MKGITQQTVLEVLSDEPKSFISLVLYFILDQERQYQRLERTLEKLISQKKVDVLKGDVSFECFFAQDFQKSGSILRCYRFVRVRE